MATGDQSDSTYQTPSLRGLQPGTVPLPGGLLLSTISDGDGQFHQVPGASHAAAPSTQHLPHALRLTLTSWGGWFAWNVPELGVTWVSTPPTEQLQ